MSTIETRLFWPYSYTLWKVVNRNTRYTNIILVANIIWRSGHAIRSSFLRDFSFLHHSRRRKTRRHSYVTWSFWPRVYGDAFWPPNRTFDVQKSEHGELASRQGRLFLLLNTTINQNIQKKNRVIGTLIKTKIDNADLILCAFSYEEEVTVACSFFPIFSKERKLGAILWHSESFSVAPKIISYLIQMK